MKKIQLFGRAAISFCLVGALLLQETMPYVSAAGGVQTNEKNKTNEESIPVESEGTEPEILSEIEENRGAFSKEYLLSDNSTQVVIYPEQIHYQNEAGSFVEIDNSLIETEDGYVNANNSYELLITDNAESKGEVIFTENDYQIAWTLVDEKMEAAVATDNIEASVTEETPDVNELVENEEIFTLKQSRVSFEGYESGISIEYAPMGDGVKENIIIPSIECGNQYSFFVQTKGLVVEQVSDNEINFIDKESGEILYYFPAPYIIDANGAVSYKAHYEIVTDGTNDNQGTAESTHDGVDETIEATEETTGETDGTTDGEDDRDYNRIFEADGMLIRIVMDEEWLSNAAFPVVLDPVLKQNRAKNLLDYGCISNEVADNGSIGKVYDSLYVGTNSAGKNFRSFVKFALPKMPANSVVSEAMLYLGGTDTEGDTHYLTARLVEEDWHNKVVITDDSDKSKALSWDNEPKYEDILDYSVRAGKFNITKAVRMWKSGEKQNNGIAFVAYNESTKKRESINLANSATSPYLKITYRTMNGLENYWGTHAVSAGTAGKGYINDYSGSLTMVNTEVATAGERMPLAITHVYDSGSNEWHYNYQQKLRVPLSSADVGIYPYVYTDADGTEHYFKKQDVTYLNNGTSVTIDAATSKITPAKDEDGLNLYIVPVQDAKLKSQYPYKLINKSASTVSYFDHYGRLAMVTDSNQYENENNKTTKERNQILITYLDDEEVSGDAISNARTLANSFKTVCYNSCIAIGSAEYLAARDELVQALDVLKTDLLVNTNIRAGKELKTALTAMSDLTDTTAGISRTTAKSKADTICNRLTELNARVEEIAKDENNQYRKYSERIATVTDAVKNKAEFCYNENGQLISVSDPTYEGNLVNQYTYDDYGNLMGIAYAGGKTASYTYQVLESSTENNENGSVHYVLGSAKDVDGYTVEFKYNAEGRVTGVSEKHVDKDGNSASGQQYTISYSTSDTTVFRFAGVDDKYGNKDDILNHYIFDEQGRQICVYSTDVEGKTVIGAQANTYESDETDSAKRYKIKDSAVVGMHTNNLLKNHSFEYEDTAWSAYKEGSILPETGAINKHYSARHYLGSYSGYVNMAKRTGGNAGLKQSTYLQAGTYTFSVYAKTENITNTSVYAKAKTASGDCYTGETLTQITPAEFDNGWTRIFVSFTLNTAQTVELCLETQTAGSATGTVVFDCAQLETGEVANDYNLLEDGSFELTDGVLPYKWTNTDSISGHNKAVKVSQSDDKEKVNPVDGNYCYSIVGQPGKDDYLRVRPGMGTTSASYVLSGWVRAQSTPIRGNRALTIKISNEYEDTDGTTVKNLASLKINVFNTEWQYFCMPIYAANWKGAQITFYYCDSIGTVYLDGLELTKNDVKSRKYDSNGKLTSYSSSLKNDTYTYDSYNRTEKQKTAAGATTTYHYAKNNEVSYTSASIGPNVYYEYDKYGNVISTSAYDPDVSAKAELYSITTYDMEGNFVTSTSDNDGNITYNHYNEKTGQLLDSILPSRQVVNVDTNGNVSRTEKAIQVTYDYDHDHDDRLVGISQGERSVTYGYGEFDDLTTIQHNGFNYKFVYDAFGNVTKVSVGEYDAEGEFVNETIITENEYNDNNGSLNKTYKGGKENGIPFLKSYDAYGNVISETIGNKQYTSYVYNNKGEMVQFMDHMVNQLHLYDYNTAGKVTKSEIFRGATASEQALESRMQIGYTKSGEVGSIFYEEAGEPIRAYSYSYAADNQPTLDTLPDKSSLVYNYDSLRRNSSTVFAPKSGATDAQKLYSEKTYKQSSLTGKTGKKATTALVETYSNKFGKSGVAKNQYTYSYDSWGNITGITETGITPGTRTYGYNEYWEVTNAQETYSNASTNTYLYQYDQGGNIISETIKSTTGNNTNNTTHTYSYRESGWKDQLISYDGKEIKYDDLGNPIDYMGDSMTWNPDGTLASIIGGGDSTTTLVKGETVTYTYIADGMRYNKMANGKTTTYHYNNGILLSESTVDNNASNPEATKETIRYYYADGKVQSLVYKKGNAAETTYFLTYNGQGDVVAIYRSSDSVLIGTYEYDLWGKPVSVKEATKGIDKDDILNKNPIRYRGYHYDQETGFYYLKARYYDAGVRRFISADDVTNLGADGNINCYNAYAYCDNSAPNKVDEDGAFAIPIVLVDVLVVAAVMVVGYFACVRLVDVTKGNHFSLEIDGRDSINQLKKPAKIAKAELELQINKRKEADHLVYVLREKAKDGCGKVRYVGRTRHEDARRNAHKRNPARSNLEFEVVQRNLTYEEARALEQAGMMFYHTLNTVDAVGNQINGITLSKWIYYKEVAKGTLQYSWNQMSNEILYWIEE